MSDEDKVEAEAETSVEHDSRPIKEIVKEATKEFAKAKGRQAFFWGLKALKAQGKDKSGSVKSVKIPKKKASALRPGDMTVEGEVKQIGRSPIDKKKTEISFLGDRGVSVQVVDSNTSYVVYERRSIK